MLHVRYVHHQDAFPHARRHPGLKTIFDDSTLLNSQLKYVGLFLLPAGLACGIMMTAWISTITTHNRIHGNTFGEGRASSLDDPMTENSDQVAFKVVFTKGTKRG